VTVALSGDAGDELFGGYSQYITPDTVQRRIKGLPSGLRPLAKVTARLLAQHAPDTLLGYDRRNALARIAAVLNGADLRHDATAYDTLLAVFVEPAPRLSRPAAIPYALDIPWIHARTAPESQMLFDLGTYLPDDILVKVDRSAMAVSLETRAPLLDHRIVEFALGQPLAHKIVDGRGKALLRAVLARYVPTALTDRPKQGFAVPLGTWLRTGLRPWADDLLRDDRLVSQWLSPAPVRHLWARHQRGHDESRRLWSVLCLLHWLRHQPA
jgi:asparagine synthase (glutamine-hydrolysing)